MKSGQSITVKPAVAVSAWLILLVLPCILISLGFDLFLESSRKQKIELLKPQINNEMSLFNEELDPAFWLEKRFAQFDQKFAFVQRQSVDVKADADFFARLDAEKLRRKLQDSLGVRVAALLYYGPDVEQTGFSVASDKEFRVNSVPGLIQKRVLGFFSRQHMHAGIFNNETGRMVASLLQNDGEKKARSNVEFILQTTFTNITPFSLSDRSLQRTITGKLGKTGPAYFYFSPARLEKAGKIYNAGGYLAVIKEADISPQKVCESAIAGENRGFSRAMVQTGRRINFPEDYSARVFSEFGEEESSVFFRSFPPETLMYLLVARGTTRILNLEKVRSLGLLSEIRVSSRLFNHELAFARPLLKFSLLLLFIAGSTIFLRLCLFGINFAVPVSAKVLLALTFSAIFPSALLLLTFATFSEYDKADRQQTLRQYLELRQSVLQKQINSQISRFENRNLELAESLEKIADTAEHQAVLKEWLQNNIPKSAYYESKTYQSLLINADNADVSQLLAKVEVELTAAMARSFMQFLFQSPYLGKKIDNLAMAFSNKMTNSATLHDMLKYKASLIDISRISRDFKFSSLPIFLEEPNFGKVPASVIILNFSKQKLIQEIFFKLKNEISIVENWGGHKVELAVFNLNADSIEILPELSSPDIPRNGLPPAVSLCNRLKRDIIWEDDDKIMTAHFGRNLPFLLFFQAEKRKERASSFFSAGVIYLIYLISLFVCVFLFSKQIFIDPVNKIAHGLNQVAGQNLSFKFSLATGDEFEALAQSLNQMTRGLIEKEKLSRYVSEEVLKDLSENYSQTMNPGGELIEAAIMFCEPVDFTRKNVNIEPFKVVQMLNYFLARTAQTVHKFGGSIDKLIDNTVMVVFRNSTGNNEHALAAVKSAFKLNSIFNGQDGQFPFRLHTGIACGKVISGKIGSKTGKLDFTVIGDRVNLAARIKSHGYLATNSGILVSAEMAEILANRIEVIRHPGIKLKGKSGTYDLFELLRVSKL